MGLSLCSYNNTIINYIISKTRDNMNVQEYKAMLAQMTKKKRKMRHYESQLQQSCKEWFDLQYPKLQKLLFAVPNGGYRDGFEAKIMKAEGVVAGVSDMILLIPRRGFGSLCIEFKTNIGRIGRQSEQQKEWQIAAETWGNKYVVIRTFEGFKKVIEEYLGS